MRRKSFDLVLVRTAAHGLVSRLVTNGGRPTAFERMATSHSSDRNQAGEARLVRKDV